VNTEDEIPQEEPGENIEERMKRWRAFLTKKVWNIGEVK
jgi:hypothetical protein